MDAHNDNNLAIQNSIFAYLAAYRPIVVGTCISQSNASLCARTNTNYYRRRRRNGYNNPICPIGDVGAIIFQNTIIPFPRPSSWPVDRHVPTPERAARYEIGFCDMHRAAIGRIYNLGPSDRLLPVVDDLVMNEFEVKVVMRYHSYRILLLPAIRTRADCHSQF